MFKKQAFISLLFSLLLSSIPTIQLCSENEKKDKITSSVIIKSAKKIFSSDVLLSIVLLYISYRGIKFLLNQALINLPLEFQKISDSELDSLLLTEEQNHIIEIFSAYFPKRIETCKFKIEIPFYFNYSKKFFPKITQEKKTNEQERLLKAATDRKVKMPQGLLFYGPPGTGKTRYAMTLAKKLDATFISIPCSKVISMFHGQSEKNTDKVFNAIKKEAAKNKNVPLVVFFDEFDSLGVSRRKLSPWEGSSTKNIVNRLLQHFDEIRQYQNVIICAATNYLDNLDNALIRGGRLDWHIEFKPMDDDRHAIFIRSLLPDQKGELLINHIANNTKNMPPADIQNLINIAQWNSIVRNEDLKKTHFKF